MVTGVAAVNALSGSFHDLSRWLTGSSRRNSSASASLSTASALMVLLIEAAWKRVRGVTGRLGCARAVAVGRDNRAVLDDGKARARHLVLREQGSRPTRRSADPLPAARIVITAVGCAPASDEPTAAAAIPPSTSRRCRFAMPHLPPVAMRTTYRTKRRTRASERSESPTSAKQSDSNHRNHAMNCFAQLLDRLVYEPGRNNKLRLITDYFRTTADPERGFALAALTGALSFRHAKPGVIRALIAERTDPVLFELSYDYVGDLSETVALMWPVPQLRD